MRLYYLDENPETCAQLYHDKHVAKIPNQITSSILGARELTTLGSTNKFIDPDFFIWNLEHLNWVILLMKALCREYEFRFERKHKDEEIINLSFEWPYAGDRTPLKWPLMDMMKYRKKLGRWTKRGIPEMFKVSDGLLPEYDTIPTL